MVVEAVDLSGHRLCWFSPAVLRSSGRRMENVGNERGLNFGFAGGSGGGGGSGQS